MTETVPRNARAHFEAVQATCASCQGPFLKRRPWGKFCSTACRRAEDKRTAQDAARYRWLRELNGDNPFEVVQWNDSGPCAISRAELDTAIDAAMAKP